MRGILLGIVLTLVVLAGMSSPPALASAKPLLQLTACAIGKTQLHARCGNLIVFENRSMRRGRKIPIHVIEIDAVHRSGRAIFWNPGGPGQDDSSLAPLIAQGAFAKELLTLHDRYDLVFVDNRGTGFSHLIGCDLYPASRPELYFAQLFPDAKLRACYVARAKDSDLSLYTTDIAADDLDDVRSALNYRKIVLDGGSYGTMFFLDYARRHPEHVESLVLEGVAPPGLLILPLEDAGGAQSAMTNLIADCARDVTCHEHFPQFAAHFAALVHRFDGGPITFRIRNAVTKREQSVAVSKEVFADRLRQMLYADEAAAYVPYIVEQAYARHYAALGALVETVTADFANLIGLNLSTTCAEDIPYVTQAELTRSSAGSFEGALRVRAQQRACRIWNVRPAAAEFVTPVRSSAPVLMLSGADDPATPAQYGRAELPYLPNGRQIVIPYASHENESACTDALIVAFVRTQDAKHLDAASCVGTSHRPPFATSLKGFGE